MTTAGTIADRSATRGLTVGALAAQTGFSTKTLRYYEDIGLLPPPARRPSGYRLYDESYRTRLSFIARAKRLGLSLEEVSQILALREAGQEPCAHVLDLVDRQIDRVDEAMVQLDAFRRQLRRLRRDAAGRRNAGSTICRIVEHAALETSALDLPALTTRRPRKGVRR